ncbi:uncharacterized protein LOC114528266 [Dendronephthya gigantea]|uniref:uncharacterized protein LOC114528266 n=1 Tax=Dendronephthya gigantea TaxID=151771 RepID=UPI001069D9ED|nr:uncharacterized protein LOC114528266 [Dendronephthya gigantea]
MISFKKNGTLGGLFVIVVILVLFETAVAANAKVFHHKPKIADEQHPTCKTSDMLHSDIVTNGILHRKRANFTFLGPVQNMKECLGLCCMDKKCELAYLVNNTKCFSTQCEDSENCKIENNEKKGRSNDVQMSLMVRNDENRKVYVTAYVIMAMAMFGAALSGTVWIAYVFVKKYREKKEDDEEREKLSKEPQVY